jgi:hypothetical protein
MAATREFLNGMAMGKVRLERYQRLRDLAKRIVADPHSIDDDTKAALKAATMKYARMLHDDPTQALEVLYHDQDGLGDLVRKAVEVIADHDAVDQHDRVPVVDHHASKVADLLVEAGSHPDRAAALQHLLHKPSGQALLARMHKVAEKESSMDTVYSIMKSAGISGVCAQIIAKRTTTLSQDEIVDAVGKIAVERYSGLSEAQAFAKIFEAPTEEGRLLRSAIKVAQASLAETMLGPGLPVQVVGGPAARNVDTAEEAEAARAELMRIGRRQWPRLTEQDAYERAFCDPANAAITARLYHRPLPSSIYPMPNEWLRGEGSQHAKSDHGGTAYNELMAKAEEYRKAHPELSESQAFEKVYTDPANREISKRERMESAPR